MPGDAPLVPREKRTEVYAMDKVQKANRKYMGEPPDEIVSRTHRRVTENSDLRGTVKTFLL